MSSRCRCTTIVSCPTRSSRAAPSASTTRRPASGASRARCRACSAFATTSPAQFSGARPSPYACSPTTSAAASAARTCCSPSTSWCCSRPSGSDVPSNGSTHASSRSSPTCRDAISATRCGWLSTRNCVSLPSTSRRSLIWAPICPRSVRSSPPAPPRRRSAARTRSPPSTCACAACSATAFPRTPIAVPDGPRRLT